MQYRKEFDNWNETKKQINYCDKKLGFKVREIWFASVGVNIGFEIDGKNNGFERPVLILKKLNRCTAIVIPLTSTVNNNPTFLRYALNGQTKSANIAQVRFIDCKRLRRKVGMMPMDDFERIRLALKTLL